MLHHQRPSRAPISSLLSRLGLPAALAGRRDDIICTHPSTLSCAQLHLLVTLSAAVLSTANRWS